MKPEVWIAAGNAAPSPAFLRSWEDRFGEFSQGANAGRHSSRAPSSEAELVKNALHALQGVAAAIKHLREQAEAFMLDPADKTTHSISSLWTFSSSTNALAKLLSEFSLAGSYRRELDHFVEFFLGADPARSPAGGGGASGSRRRRRRGRKVEEVSRETPRSGAFRLGLLSQAFAAAVRTILQAHSASLNSLLGSLSRRRNQPELASDRHGGALFGFGHCFVSLLELHLHTGELRIQLQALMHICLLDGGAVNTRENFQSFPKGADLLTHLYTLLLEPDPVHLGLLRFLFDRTFEPYAGFIRSCIYSATLEDPHGEFILEKTRSEQQEQSTLKVRSGVNTPTFLVHSCTEILRAAQQLEVISKLPGAEDYVQVLSSLKPRRVSADAEKGHLREDAGSKPENTAGIESNEEAVIVELSSEASDAQQDELSAPEPGKKLQSLYFVDEEQEEEPGSFFLSGYNRGASWLDVGLPRNPFAGNELSLYGYISTLFTDNEDAWDFRSAEVNEDGLLKKLVPELAQVGLLTLPKHAIRRPSSEVNLVEILLSDANLPVIREVEDNREIVPEVKLQLPEVETGSVDDPNKEPARGGGSWESWMRIAGTDQVSGADEALIESGILVESAEQVKINSDVPISVVVEKTIVQEIRTQYRLVSSFAVRVLQEKLHLEHHYLALRRYYFMEVGDWADNFITALCSHKWGLVCGQHHQVEAQGMLEAALQKSSCEGDSYAERLYILKRPPEEEESCEFVDYNRLEAFDFIELEYQLEWPLNLILTPENFRMYKSVFRLLLRVRHVVFALREISSNLQIMERSSRKASADQKHRFRALQLFRHQIGHFVTVVQFHIQSQLLHVIWSGFLHSIQHEIQNMQDLEVVHYKYLKNAVHQSFLSPELAGVKSSMDNIMQCLLDFRAYLKNIRAVGDESEICSHQLYSKVVELSSSFLKNMRSLHRFHLNSEGHLQLSEFWMALDFNSYFASTC